MYGLRSGGRWRWTRHFLLVLLLSLLAATPPKALGYLVDTKAVLNGCEDHWTLQHSAAMPLLFQMTVCVDVRVVVPGAWVAFSYSSVHAARPELGLEGDDEALYGWLLRVRHRFPLRLSPTHWHRVCLRRDVQRNSFSLEVDGMTVAERTVIARAIPPSGSLWLGCRPRDRPPGAELGKVELYMFRVWADLGGHGPCEDGAVIGWNARNWGVTSPRARQRDPNLLCDHRRLRRGARAHSTVANGVHSAPTTGLGRLFSPAPAVTSPTATSSPAIATAATNISNQTPKATGFPSINCDISKLCSNKDAYFWMSIRVEAKDGSKTEQDVSKLVSAAFGCHGDSGDAAPAVTGFIDFCQSDRQLQEVKVNCRDKKNIRNTICDVLLQLSHGVSACELQRAGASALQQAGDEQIQATITGEVERVGLNLCEGVEPSAGGFVRCTSTSPLDDVCRGNKLSQLTCSLAEPGSAPGPQPQSQSCGSDQPRYCDCAAFCNSASQYYAMRINISRASVNVNSLKNLFKALAVNQTCRKGSQCQETLKRYQNVQIECHGTEKRLYSCMVILTMSGPVDGCILNQLLQQVIDGKQGVTIEGPLTRMVVCGPPGLSVTTLLASNLTWVSSDLLTSDVCQPDPTLFKCEADEKLAVLLVDSCAPTTTQSTTQPPTLSGDITTSPAASMTNTTEQTYTTAGNTSAAQQTDASRGPAQPSTTAPLTTVNSTQSSTAQPVLQTSLKNMTVTATAAAENTTSPVNGTLLTPTENTQLQNTTAAHPNTREFTIFSPVNSTLQITPTDLIDVTFNTTTFSPDHTTVSNITTVRTSTPSPNDTTVNITTVGTSTPSPNDTTVNITTVDTFTPSPSDTTANITTVNTPTPSPNDTTANITTVGTSTPSPNDTTANITTVDTFTPSPSDTTANITTVNTPTPSPNDTTANITTVNTPTPSPNDTTANITTVDTFTPSPSDTTANITTVNTPTPSPNDTAVSNITTVDTFTPPPNDTTVNITTVDTSTRSPSDTTVSNITTVDTFTPSPNDTTANITTVDTFTPPPNDTTVSNITTVDTSTPSPNDTTANITTVDTSTLSPSDTTMSNITTVDTSTPSPSDTTGYNVTTVPSNTTVSTFTRSPSHTTVYNVTTAANNYTTASNNYTTEHNVTTMNNDRNIHNGTITSNTTISPSATSPDHTTVNNVTTANNNRTLHNGSVTSNETMTTVTPSPDYTTVNNVTTASNENITTAAISQNETTTDNVTVAPIGATQQNTTGPQKNTTASAAAGQGNQTLLNATTPTETSTVDNTTPVTDDSSKSTVAPPNNQTGNHTTAGVTGSPVTIGGSDTNFTTAATGVSPVTRRNETAGVGFNLSSTASGLTTGLNPTTGGPEVTSTATATATSPRTLPAPTNNVTAKVSTPQTTTLSSTTTTKPGTGATAATTVETTLSQAALEEQANELLDQTQDPSQLNSSQVAQLVGNLQKLLDSPTVSKAVGQKAIDIISNLMDGSAVALSESANRMIQTVDDLGLKLVVDGDREVVSSRSLVLAVRPVDGSNFPTTSVDIFNPDNVQLRALSRSRSKRSDSALGSVFLPSSLTAGLSPEKQRQANRLQFTFYTKPALFQDASLNNQTLVSPVLGSSVANLSISNLSENIHFTIRNINPVHGNFVASCAFWDFAQNGGGGGWSSAGCFVVNSTLEYTTCSCNHLTSFAVLLDLSRQGLNDKKQAQILTFITYIGCGISAIFLAVTLLTYLSFEKLLRDIPAKILVQLCMSLLLLNLVFLLDGWLALYPAVGLCISTAFFLHYFLLTSFTWAGLEALHMYLSVVQVFTPYLSRYMLKFSLMGWGIPLIVVIIVIAVDKDNYGLVTYGRYIDGTTDDFCWLRNDIAFYVGVVAYFLLMFSLCLLVFIMVMVQLARIKRQNPQNRSPNRNVMTDMRSIAGLVILLGLTWGFALFAWGPLYLPFVYLFTIFNTLQGFLVFVFHCAVKENVRRQWRTYLCCGRLRLAENSDWSRTATQNHRNVSVTTATTTAPHFTSRSSSVISDTTNSSGSVFVDSGISDGSNSDVVLNELHRRNLSL